MSLVLISPYPIGSEGPAEVITYQSDPLTFNGNTLVLGSPGANQLALKPGLRAALQVDNSNLMLSEEET